MTGTIAKNNFLALISLLCPSVGGCFPPALGRPAAKLFDPALQRNLTLNAIYLNRQMAVGMGERKRKKRETRP